MKLKDTPWKKSYDQPRQHIKKQRYYFANKGPSSQSCGFSSSHVWMWDLDYKESRAPKNWCLWTVVLEKTLGSPLDFKEIQPVHPKGDQSWVFTGRTDAEAETPILWPPDAKNWLIGKDPDAGRDWGQEEKGTTEDEMAGWHHQSNGYVLGQTLGDGEGQGSLMCWSPWGHEELDTTWQPNNNKGSMQWRVAETKAGVASKARLGSLDFLGQAVESHAKALSLAVVWLEHHFGEMRPWWWDPVTQNVTLSSRCCSQPPACYSSWMFVRTAVTSCSLSCIPPIAWASAPLQMCIPAPTCCSRPMLMQVMGNNVAAPFQACEFNNLVCGGLLKDYEASVFYWEAVMI